MALSIKKKIINSSIAFQHLHPVIVSFLQCPYLLIGEIRITLTLIYHYALS